MYAPDRSTPLHPRTLSEGAASLLPGQRRPAVLWTITLHRGRHRRRGRSRPRLGPLDRAAGLSVGGARRWQPANRCRRPSRCCRRSGALRQQLGRSRHAITLDLPEIDVVPERPRLAVAPARRVADRAVQRRDQPADRDVRGRDHGARAESASCGPCPNPTGAGRDVAPVDRCAGHPVAGEPAARRRDRPAGRRRPEAGRLPGARRETASRCGLPAVRRRGAGHRPGTPASGPCTRTSRRRCGGWSTGSARRSASRCTPADPVPDWVLDRFQTLPKVMATADQRGNALDKACIGAVGALLLAGREGEEFTGTVLLVDQAKERATVVLDDPPVRAWCAPDGLREGDVVRVVLDSADPATLQLPGPPRRPRDRRRPVAG